MLKDKKKSMLYRKVSERDNKRFIVQTKELTRFAPLDTIINYLKTKPLQSDYLTGFGLSSGEIFF